MRDVRNAIYNSALAPHTHARTLYPLLLFLFLPPLHERSMLPSLPLTSLHASKIDFSVYFVLSAVHTNTHTLTHALHSLSLSFSRSL